MTVKNGMMIVCHHLVMMFFGKGFFEGGAFKLIQLDAQNDSNLKQKFVKAFNQTEASLQSFFEQLLLMNNALVQRVLTDTQLLQVKSQVISTLQNVLKIQCVSNIKKKTYCQYFGRNNFNIISCSSRSVVLNCISIQRIIAQVYPTSANQQDRLIIELLNEIKYNNMLHNINTVTYTEPAKPWLANTVKKKGTTHR